MITKKILVDLFLVKNRFVGYGEFCAQLGMELAKRAAELKEKYAIELYFLVEKRNRGCFGDDVNYVVMSHNLLPLLFLYPYKFDLFHETRQICKFSSPMHAGHTLLTIHDINFKYEKKGHKREKYSKRFKRNLGKSDYVNFITDFVKTDVESAFEVKAKKTVIYNGATDLTALAPQTYPFSTPGIPKNDFLLHISGLNPKKNVHLLIEMMKYLPQEKIVIVGNWNSRYGESNKELIRKLDLKNVYCVGNVDENQKAWLYNNCKAFCFPSLCEGFGLPPIEAMYFGKPVFLSRMTSLPEIGGEDAFYFDVLDPEKMAETVSSSLGNMPEGLSQKLKQNASRFSWKNCADNYINLYLEILNMVPIS